MPAQHHSMGVRARIDALDADLAATGRKFHAGDAVLIRTVRERYAMTDPDFFVQQMANLGAREPAGRA
jgi:hypothetical protein